MAINEDDAAETAMQEAPDLNISGEGMVDLWVDRDQEDEIELINHKESK